MTLKSFTSAVPVIATCDVVGTVRYFEDTLGFEQQWAWGDPPVYAGVRAGNALLYVAHDPTWPPPSKNAAWAPISFFGSPTSTAPTRNIAPVMPKSQKSWPRVRGESGNMLSASPTAIF